MKSCGKFEDSEKIGKIFSCFCCAKQTINYTPLYFSWKQPVKNNWNYREVLKSASQCAL